MSSSSEPMHSRKSRLAVPAGGDPLMASPNTGSRKGLAASLTANGGSSNSNGGSSGLLGASGTPMQYMHRFTDVRQMDIQSALDQMKTLLTTRPQTVYKTAYYRKQTKNHWARDDPAFCALQIVFLVIASVAYSVAFRIRVGPSVSFLLQSVLWNWLGVGLLASTGGREIANRHLTSHQKSSSHVRQQVEWLYAFDIHCNSFFPVFVVLYGLQFFSLPVALGEGLLPLFVSNTLYAAAFSWYWYITHLGYRALPFLANTEVFLFPIAAIMLLYVTMLVGYPFGFGWNATRVMARFYFI